MPAADLPPGRWAPTGSTTVAAVIGDPVAHSRSPAIHNAAFAEAGLDWVFVALHVPAGSAGAAVEAMRTLGIGGMSVTMPHKHEVLGALDSLSGQAERLAAVNCIARDGDRLVGHNTDGAGFVAALEADDVSLVGARVVVVGAGGAARAVVLALGGAGVGEVAVVNRSAERGESAAELAGVRGRAVAARDARAAVSGADIVVNATPVGMAEGDGSAVDPHALHAGQVVVDLIYHPARTPLLAAAEAAGARALNGLPMLVHQAALAFTTWTGRPAPLAAMARAAAIPQRAANPRAGP